MYTLCKACVCEALETLKLDNCGPLSDQNAFEMLSVLIAFIACIGNPCNFTIHVP